MTAADSAAAVAFMTLFLEQDQDSRSHRQAMDALLDGPRDPLLWGLAGMVRNVLEQYGSRMQPPLSAVKLLQLIAAHPSMDPTADPSPSEGS